MLNRLGIVPFTRINNKINLSSKLSTIIAREQEKLSSIFYDGKANKAPTHHQLLDIQKSFLYVCTETVYNYPTEYLSEKSYKGITCKRPFVILGAPGSLKRLQEFGFKTFDSWWDESYDSILSDQKRLLKVYAIIKDICNRSYADLDKILIEMEPILDYNFNHYQTFSQNELNSFEKQCILNINR